MKTAYTNISPVTNSYTNFNHIFLLSKYKIDKVYICVWDLFVYENPVFKEYLPRDMTKEEKLEQNVKNIEKILCHLGIDYKIIYFSEAWKRLFKNSKHAFEFQKILSNIELEDITNPNIKYSPFSKISVAKLNYIIADYMFAMTLPEIFPEICSTVPKIYLTSERFKPFNKLILKSINPSISGYSVPNVEFVDFVPVVINKKGEIPALESSSLKIRDVLFEYLSSKDISKKEIFDLLNVIGNKALKYKKRVYEPNTFCNILTRLDKEEQADILSVYMQDYLQNVNCILSKGKEQEETNVTFISTIADFKSKVKPLNNLKVAVIKHCNSNNTSMDISKKTGLKLSTVSTYLSRLRTQKIISDDRKPRLISDKIVIDLKNMEV